MDACTVLTDDLEESGPVRCKDIDPLRQDTGVIIIVRDHDCQFGIVYDCGQNTLYQYVLNSEKGSRRYYIKSAFAMPDERKALQEQRPLLNTGDGFKKIIITKDALAPLYNENGILVMSIFDFLLNPDSLDI